MADHAQLHRAVRKIACDMVKRLYPRRLGRERQEELATSLVRQWAGYEGHAALFTPRGRYWLELTAMPPKGFNVAVTQVPGHPIEAFLKDWKIERGQVPAIVRRLNLSQSAEFTNTLGRCLRMWIDPKQRSVHMEPLDDENKAT
jgi:hypothetical protein